MVKWKDIPADGERDCGRGSAADIKALVGSRGLGLGVAESGRRVWDDRKIYLNSGNEVTDVL